MKPRLHTDARYRSLAERFGTPLYLYDAPTIRQRCADLAGFDVVRYAQKACNNLEILRSMRRCGVWVDAVSAGELERALLAGFPEDRIEFTADLFDRASLALLARRSVGVNIGSPDMLEQLAEIRSGDAVTLRLNPGFGHGHDRKVTTGGPESKHGIWHEDLREVTLRAQRLGHRIVGLHVHIGSGSDLANLERVCSFMEQSAQRVGDTLVKISSGGGLPIPYRDTDVPFDVARYTRAWIETRDRIAERLGQPVRVEVEPGRYLVAEAGALLTEVRATKRAGHVDYILVDAGFGNLLRPAMYGAFHQVSVVGRDDEPLSPRVVAGPLCESADVLTQTTGSQLDPRPLPAARVGDLVCVHDTGAYASSMSMNYNGRPFAAEVLIDGDEERLIRRRQTLEQTWENELEVD